MDDNKTDANYLNEIRRKSIEVEDVSRRSNRARARNNANRNTNHETKRKNNVG